MQKHHLVPMVVVTSCFLSCFNCMHGPTSSVLNLKVRRLISCLSNLKQHAMVSSAVESISPFTAVV